MGHTVLCRPGLFYSVIQISRDERWKQSPQSTTQRYILVASVYDLKNKIGDSYTATRTAPSDSPALESPISTHFDGLTHAGGIAPPRLTKTSPKMRLLTAPRRTQLTCRLDPAASPTQKKRIRRKKNLLHHRVTTFTSLTKGGTIGYRERPELVFW